MADYYGQLAIAIIKSQEELIGSIAWQQAANVEDLTIVDGTVTIESSEPEAVINNLVTQYTHIFGQAAVEVCKMAARRLSQGNSAAETLPSLLR